MTVMEHIESRGHLYHGAQQRAISVLAVVILFTVAFALLVLVMAVIPVNVMLAKMVNPSAVNAMWRNSMNQLALRAFVAGVACWFALALTRRARGRLTGPGILTLGAVTSGALAGAIDVGLHKLWVRQMIEAYHSSRLSGNAFSLGITASVAAATTLVLMARRMRKVPTA